MVAIGVIDELTLEGGLEAVVSARNPTLLERNNTFFNADIESLVESLLLSHCPTMFFMIFVLDSCHQLLLNLGSKKHYI